VVFLELGTLIGLIGGLFVIVGSILFAAEFDMVVAMGFVDVTSFIIVFVGVITCTFFGYPMNTVLGAMKTMGKVFKPPNLDPAAAITKIIDLANQARKEGILALEESAQQMDDTFLQKGVMLIVDGTDPELVRSILETELSYIESRHSQARGVWEYMATMGPAWGMLGTLVALIVMLQNLNDPGSLGPAMAVAIITTLYGFLVANYLCTPVATKLKFFSNAEVLMKEVLIEGMLSIQAGENPRIIEEKLKAFLSPAIRSRVGDEPVKSGGGGEEDEE
jgi:chemotaxis protein MotA